MTDDELLRFCAANDGLRVERDVNGELLVMTPAGGSTGKKNTDVIIDLGIWNRQNDRGIVFESNTGFILPDGSMLSPDAAWLERSRWELHSESSTLARPIVIRLMTYVNVPRDAHRRKIGRMT